LIFTIKLSILSVKISNIQNKVQNFGFWLFESNKKMRKIRVEEISKTVRNLALKANYRIRPDVEKALRKIYKRESSPLCKWAVAQVLENLRIAEREQIPVCQDTGFVVIFVELGEEVKIEGNLYQAIEKGVRQAYKEGYFRDSVVTDPLRQTNGRTDKRSNAKRFSEIHLELVPGDKLKINLMPKGAGSENNSAYINLLPGIGEEGVKKFVLETVEKGAYTSCPPIIVGVGIGGNFETCTLLAKKALLRPLGLRHQDSYYAQLEKEILKEINALGIGAQGFGGGITAFDVFIETYPCHIASLPVAVNLQCNACRHEVARF
jgi:fumarate hydratase subunit alpha